METPPRPCKSLTKPMLIWVAFWLPVIQENVFECALFQMVTFCSGLWWGQDYKTIILHENQMSYMYPRQISLPVISYISLQVHIILVDIFETIFNSSGECL